MRDPHLTDYENSLLHRPYCGNPFIAPGELGSKSARSKTKVGQAGAPEDEEYYSFKFVDPTQDFSNEETVMPNTIESSKSVLPVIMPNVKPNAQEEDLPL